MDHRVIYPGIALLSAASLNLELVLTRIFSISQGHFLAFMVISIALLGIGAGGVFLALTPSRTAGTLFRRLCFFSLGFSVSAVAGYFFANLLPFDPTTLSWEWQQIVWIGCYYLLLGLPFFFSGLTLAEAFSRLLPRSTLLYCSDLTGAALGCWVIYAALGPLDEPGTVLVSAGMGALAAMLFGASQPRLLRISALFFIATLGVLCFRPRALHINISPYRSLPTVLRYPQARLVSTAHDAYARLDVVESPAVRFAPGLSLRYTRPLPRQMGLVLDGNFVSAVTNMRDNSNGLEFTSFLPTSLPYALRSIDSFLALEPQGGLDILTALRHKVNSIRAVYSYPLVLKTLRGDLAAFSGRMYERAHVATTVSSVRTFLACDSGRYDLIQYCLADVFGAMSTGIHGIGEHYVLTTGALSACYHLLRPEGYLLFSCYLLPPPRAELRLISLLLSALESIPGTTPGAQMIMVRSLGTMVVLVKKGPVGTEEENRLDSFCHSRGFELLYSPRRGIPPHPGGQASKDLLKEGVGRLMNPHTREEFIRTYPFDLRPVTDGRPFFNQFFRLSTVREAYRMLGRKWQPFVEGEFLLSLVMVQACALSGLLILGPLCFLSRSARLPAKPFLLYFVGTGCGFMCVEIALMQRFILFLDHPIKAMTVVLSGLLVAAGIGSLCSQPLARRFRERAAWLPLVTAAVVWCYCVGMALPGSWAARAGPGCRVLLALGALVPIGFALGLPFPLGVMKAGALSPRMVPWAWGINGCASVSGAVLALMVATGCGFTVVLGMASGFYVLASWVLVWFWRSG